MQCSACRSKHIAPHETGKAVQNEKAAEQAKKKKQKQTAIQQANWAASKQAVPERLAEWKFRQLVGCSKSHGCKIHWQTEDGEDCPRSECTWQPAASVPMLPGSAVELDAVEMQGARISLEVSGKVYEATVHDKDDAGCGGPVNASYYLKYKKKAASRGRSKANGWVNLELPVGEKCSWWRMDGYETCNEGFGSDGDGASAEDGMVELSLSDSDVSSDEV